MTYLDVLSRKSKRSRGDDSDSDDGPPPDPDEPATAPVAKKEKKPTGDARDIQVSARKSEDKGGQNMQGGLSAVRREMLQTIHAEEDESWINYEFKGDAVCFLRCDLSIGSADCRNRRKSRMRRSTLYCRETKNIYAVNLIYPAFASRLRAACRPRSDSAKTTRPRRLHEAQSPTKD